MRLISFLSECRECHFAVEESLFVTPEARRYFSTLPRSKSALRAYEGFHQFDLFFVDCLLRHEVGQEDFYVRMIGLAKDVLTAYNDTHHERGMDCDLENARRCTVVEADPALQPDVHPLTLREREEIFSERKTSLLLRKRLRKLTASASDVAEMRLELYERIRRFDNYVKVRRILSKLSAEDRLALDTNAIGETRYAHVLYTVDACLARYLSFRLGKPVSAILSGDDLAAPSRYSLCPYCGDRIVDVGKQRRKCCTKPACRRQYERVRKRERRDRMRTERTRRQ